MKRMLFWPTAILASVLLGLVSAYAALYLVVAGTESVFSGKWATNKNTASRDAGIYLRTSVAVMGLMAMTREESVYYSTVTDTEGVFLNGNCTYQLKGRDLPARWWSITAYGMDHYFMNTGIDKYSISQSSIVRNEDGTYTATISPEKHKTNWIPSAKGKYFQLTARFYNPEQSVYDHPGKVQLPTITKVKCS